MLKSILMFFGRMFLRAAMDKALRKVIEAAVLDAEKTEVSGDSKMKLVLDQVKRSGTKALLEETESTLRTKIEQVIDDLKV